MPGRLEDYEPVEDRIRRFWAEHNEGRILTELVQADGNQYIVKAEVWFDPSGGPTTTGYAEETVGSSPVNRTHAIENCETSAIGRALANAGYAPKGARPSREEMQKAERQRVTPAAEARDRLRALVKEQGLNKDLIAPAFQRLYESDINHEENAQRIDGFTELLKLDSAAVLSRVSVIHACAVEPQEVNDP